MQAARRPGYPHALIAVRLEELPQRPTVITPGKTRQIDGLIGCSQALRGVLHKIDIYGPTDAPVLITGETGTGKELAARALHTHSKRRQRPFVAVNCAALSEELLESELFGHEKGAFTSAVRSHRGRFERASGGTLFLDEIGDMPLRLQAKLLRVLEVGVIERVGGEREVAVDVRLVTATNVPLELTVQSRAFRLDLYHRLEVLRIHMPPLRERPEDIPLLAAHFIEQFNAKYQRRVRGLTPDAIALLQGYDWPGNVRELRNILERVYVETVADAIGRKAFEEWVQERTRFYPGTWNVQALHDVRATRPALIPPSPGGPQTPWPRLASASDEGSIIDVIPQPSHHRPVRPPRASAPDVSHDASRPLTRKHIVWSYHQAAGNLTQAARLLGVHKTTLYRRMKALGVTRDDLVASGLPPGRAYTGEEHE